MTEPCSEKWCSAEFEVCLEASLFICWSKIQVNSFRSGVNLAHSRAVLKLSEPCSFWDGFKQTEPCSFCQVKYVTTVRCACHAIKRKFLSRGPQHHPALFSTKNAAPVHHEKLHESRILYTGERRGSFPCFVAIGDAHNRR